MVGLSILCHLQEGDTVPQDTENPLAAPECLELIQGSWGSTLATGVVGTLAIQHEGWLGPEATGRQQRPTSFTSLLLGVCSDVPELERHLSTQAQLTLCCGMSDTL